MLEWLFTIVALIVLSQYLLGPILVWKSQKFPPKYRFEKLDLEKLMPDKGETFQYLHDEICAAGFECVGSSSLDSSNAGMLFSIYYNVENNLCSTLSYARASHINSIQIEFTRLYESGHVVNVNNNPLFNIYPIWDKKISYRYADINDFAELYELARELISHHDLTHKPKIVDVGCVFEEVERHLNEELSMLVTRGWVSPRVKNGVRSMTLKGTLLMTWQLCWPIKFYLNRKDEKFAANAPSR